MVKKPRQIPLRLKKDQALHREILPNHPRKKEIEESIRKNKAGFKGEKELDYHLSFLPENDFMIFRGLHLPLFQIDAFVLCHLFGIIIECKNWAGTLSYDPKTGQLIREFDGKKEGFPDPRLQAKRQKIQLQKWLASHKIKSFPIFYQAAISFPSTIIDSSADFLLLAERIPEKILQIKNQHANQPPLSSYQLNKISEFFLLHHTSPDIHIMDTYHLHPSDLRKGVTCPQCSHYLMKRIHGSWHCDSCHTNNKKAHEQVIRDHLLIHGKMTNTDFQRTLCLPSGYSVYRLLAPMNLPSSGKSKDRIYYSPETGYNRSINELEDRSL